MLCMSTQYFSPLSELVWDLLRDINHSYYCCNLHFNLLAANVKAGRDVAGFRGSDGGEKETGRGDLGASVWRSVTKGKTRPCQQQLSYRDTDSEETVWCSEDKPVCCSHCYAASTHITVRFTHYLVFCNRITRLTFNRLISIIRTHQRIVETIATFFLLLEWS